MKAMTPERLAEIKAAMPTMTRRELIKHFNISSNTLTKYAIQKEPAHDKRLTITTPEQVEKVRELTEQGLSVRAIGEKIGISHRQVRRVREKHGITAVPLVERQKVETPKNNGRNPMRYLTVWKPVAATSEIEVAVDLLRRQCIVFAESTLRYPSRVPERYGAETLFRVGSERNVPAARVVEMAGVL